MRYLAVLLFLLLPTLVFAQAAGDVHEVHEQHLWTALATLGTSLFGLVGWAFRTWWKSRVEEKHKARIERKLEEDWTNGDDTLPGSINPGRTLPQLIEVVHEDLKEFKRETNGRLTKLTEDIGRVKGKLDMN